MNKKVLKTLEYHKILNIIASLADSEPGRERVLNLHPLLFKRKNKAASQADRRCCKQIISKGQAGLHSRCGRNGYVKAT